MERNTTVINNGKFSTIKEINIDGVLYDKPDEIAMEFNNYFTNICPKLANKIDPVPGSYLDYIKARVHNTMYVIPTTSDEILKICSILKSNKSAGFDNFSPKAIKVIISNIVQPLCDIVNKSLFMRIFPVS